MAWSGAEGRWTRVEGVQNVFFNLRQRGKLAPTNINVTWNGMSTMTLLAEVGKEEN